MSAVRQRASGSAARAAAIAGVVLVALGMTLVSQARAEAPVPPAPSLQPPEGDDVKASVTVYQEDDVISASPGADYRARMSWSSTGEVRTAKVVTALKGRGTFAATVGASYPNGTCGNITESLDANGEVSDSTKLFFRFVPKDINRPELGLRGWFISTPTAQWRGTLTSATADACGGTTTRDGGSTFQGQGFAGGNQIGGTPMPAPRVFRTRFGDIRITGSAQYGSGLTRQLVRFTFVCSSAAACFRLPPVGSEGLEVGWKFRGATCVPAPDGTFRLRVKMRMIVNNGSGTSLTKATWAQGMRASARLEAPGAGLQFTRQWREERIGGLATNTRYVHDFTVLTDNVSAASVWNLHVKYVWDILGGRDHVEEFTSSRAYDCSKVLNPAVPSPSPGGGPGVDLLPAFAPPSAGASPG